MARKSLSGAIPAAWFPALAQLLENESPVFQRHVLDYVREVIEDPDRHMRTMAQYRKSKSLPVREVREFLKHLRPAPDFRPEAALVRELLGLIQDLKPGSHVSTADIASLIAAEILHRRRWDEVMERNPDTLMALRRRIKS